MSTSKFAKKGTLVVDFENAKLHKVGDKNLVTKKALKDKGIEEAPEPKSAKKGKAEKPVKAAKKASKPKAEPKEKAEDNRKIKLLTKDNPKREGSASYDRFELYRDNKTVQAFLEAGGKSADLRYDENAGYIEVA